jgi:uncharacterized protein (TIGR02246 family)
MGRTRFAFLLTLMLAATACQPAAEPPAAVKDTSASDVAAINAVRDAYIAAENAGDAAAVAALYADDAMLMAPDMPAASGKAAIEAHLQQQYSGMTFELGIGSTQTKVAGDIGYDAGTHHIRLTPKAAAADAKAAKAASQPMEVDGKHIVLLARQADGSWKITHLIFNSDAPMPPPSGAARRP